LVENGGSEWEKVTKVTFNMIHKPSHSIFLPSLPPYFSLCLSLSLSLSLSLALSASLSRSIYLCLYVALSPSLPPSLSLCVCVCVRGHVYVCVASFSIIQEIRSDVARTFMGVDSTHAHASTLKPTDAPSCRQQQQANTLPSNAQQTVVGIQSIKSAHHI
jgi:hypothetical protein